MLCGECVNIAAATNVYGLMYVVWALGSQMCSGFMQVRVIQLCNMFLGVGCRCNSVCRTSKIMGLLIYVQNRSKGEVLCLFQQAGYMLYVYVGSLHLSVLIYVCVCSLEADSQARRLNKFCIMCLCLTYPQVVYVMYVVVV